MKIKIFFTALFFLLFVSQKVVALDLSVTATNETCSGNGTLSFTVTNATVGIPIFYAIYLLPNTTTPLVTTSSSSYNTLASGNYLVIATQTVNGIPTTASQNATINNAIIPLTFSITGTNVFCGNDGVITVNASATAVSYQILAGPITTGVQSNNIFTGLTTGVYNIRVVDNCNVGIVQAFTLLSTSPGLQILGPNFLQQLNCNSISVSHNVSAISGTQISYPLSIQTDVFTPTGTVISSTQVVTSGNTFILTIPSLNNQSYFYNITITDGCGISYVLNNNSVSFTPIQISGPQIDSTSPSSCNSLALVHTLSLNANNLFLYPISVQTTIFSPSGSSSISNQTLTAGTSIQLTIPTINNTSYSYDILVTDACGNTYSLTNNVVLVNSNVQASTGVAGCNDNFVSLLLSNLVPPYNVNFIANPVGFNPSNFNSNYPGPFTNDIISFGGLGNSLPQGAYIVEVTDGCGNTIQSNFVIQPPQPTLVLDIVSQAGCGLNNGSIALFFNPLKEIDTVILIAAPLTYPNALPNNLSQFIGTDNIFLLENLAVGTYTFNLTDKCGNSFTHTATVGTTSGNITLTNRPGCELGYTSVVISVQNSQITFIEIIEAPALFTFQLPYNISFNIASNGSMYMNSLPQGTYKFRIVDNCGADRIEERTIEGLNAGNTNLTITEKCGAFDLQFFHTSNGVFFSTYWLQKFNPQDNVWEHPSTGFDYVAGNNLSTVNAVALQNNATNFNLAYSGTFRIVKVFNNFSNGSTNFNRCIVVLDEFEFDGGPKIIDAYAFPCTNNTQEVVIIVNGGVNPLQYSITLKDGLPFVINNNTSNTFTGLAPGTYNFRVEDVCGNFDNRPFNVTLLPEPEIIATNLCDGNVGQLEIQNFPFVTYQWFNTLNPAVILSTSNVLQFSPFSSVNDVGFYAVQLSSSNANSCINQTIEYEINASGFNPNAGNDNALSLCSENQQIFLNSFLTNPHDAGGVWTDSNNVVLTNTFINPIDFTAGNYAFTYTVTGFCTISDSALITVTIKDLPLAPVLSAPNPICVADDVLLESNSIANATYFWTGPNGFTSSSQNPLIQNFSAINNGTYLAFVTVDGCNSLTEQIIINANPIPDFTIDGVSSICVGQNETLTINPTNFSLSSATIEWYYENILLSNQTNFSLQINQFGTYKAIINNNGCSSEREVEVTERINSFAIELEQGCNGNQYEVKVINSLDFPNATYSWTGPNNFSSSNQNIIVPNLQIGQYNVEVTDGLGCKSNAFVLITNTNCFIPNGFSPDEDGFNDSFDLTGYNVKKIYIYNRYGRLVYSKDNYINEWKGQTNANEILPASTYFYVLEFNEAENKTGWVYVSY